MTVQVTTRHSEDFDIFDYATTPTKYEMTSILVATPIRKSEVKAFRRYRRTNGPDKYELVDEITF